MCTNPISVPVKVGGRIIRYQQIGCGYCEECLNGDSMNFTQRVYMESLHYGSVHFVTLTYDNEFLPFQVDHASIVSQYSDKYHRADVVPEVHVCPSLRRSDVISRLKSFREMHDNLDFSYSFVGEYGKFGRPHYHGLLFGLSDKDVAEFCREFWSLGFTDWKRVPLASFDDRSDISAVGLYVSKYLKKGSFEKAEVRNGVCEVPRSFSSIGFGKKNIARLRSWYLCEDRFGVVDINKTPFPAGFISAVETRLDRFVIGSKVFPLCKFYRREFLYIDFIDPLSGRKSRKASRLSQILARRASLRFNGKYEKQLASIAEIQNQDLRLAKVQATIRAHAVVLRNREENSASIHKKYLQKSRVS